MIYRTLFQLTFEFLAAVALSSNDNVIALQNAASVWSASVTIRSKKASFELDRLVPDKALAS